MAHKWAEVLHHPCVLVGPPTRGQSERWPTSGRKCYITPAFLGVPVQGDKVKGGPQVGGSATSPLRSRVTQTRGQSQRWPTSGRRCYITPAFLGVPVQGDKVKGGPQVGGSATSPLRSRVTQTRGQSQRWPTSGRRCYITPAFLGVPKQGDKVNGSPQVGRSATLALRSRVSPKEGTKSMLANKWAEVLHHPCVLGGPETRRQSPRWPTSGRKCYITPAF